MQPNPGDIYCVFSERLNKYTACQVTRIPGGRRTVIILELDWAGDSLPRENELKNMKPLICDFMYWEENLQLYHVPPEVPANYILAGNIPPIINDDSNSYSGWRVGYSLFRQMEWRRIPEDKRRKFKEANESSGKVTLAGREVGIDAHLIYDSSFEITRARELSVLPCLSHINLERWYADLPDFLGENPFILELSLSGHGQSVLDFRKSRLHKLSVQMDGVESLYVNDQLEKLILYGNMDHPFTVHAFDKGKWLQMQVQNNPVYNCGLPNLNSLHCVEVRDFDMEKTVDAYPGLRELRLWGSPGTISGFGTVSRLKHLRQFSVNNLFGFSGGDIPKPEEMPDLVWFWMTSIPEDAAKTAKQLYKKREGLDLRILQGRKPEWLAQNLNNPFRNWDGEDHIPQAAAKKAAAQYRKTRGEILGIIININDDTQDKLDKAVSDFTRAFNAMDKRKGFIETVEREEIYEALKELLDLIPENTAVNKDSLIETFDTVRDF